MKASDFLSELRVLDPYSKVVKQAEIILDKSIPEYMKRTRSIGEDDWEDDPDLLAKVLNKHSKGTAFAWNVVPEGTKAVDWYVHSASVHGDGKIIFNLHPESIDGKWGPKSFREVIMRFVEHEGIHLTQREKMGKEKYKELPSGYMKGRQIAGKDGDFSIVAQYYFSDPQEIMAHASDLANEVMKLDNPAKVIRNPEKYIDELPTYDKHKQHGFGPDHAVVKRLMRYASEYLRKKGVKI